MNAIKISSEEYNNLLNRVQELEEENRKLNMEIGRYAGEVGEMAQTIDDEVSDLKRLAMRMCKAGE